MTFGKYFTVAMCRPALVDAPPLADALCGVRHSRRDPRRLPAPHPHSVESSRRAGSTWGDLEAVTTRSRPYALHSTASSLSDGTSTSQSSRIRHVVTTDASDLRFVYGNFARSTDGPNKITVRAAIELPGVALIPVFFAAKRDVIIDPGAIAISDPLAVTVADQAVIYSRQYVSVASAGEKWPLGMHSASGTRVEWVSNGSPALDWTLGGGPGGTGLEAYAPFAILGRSHQRVPVIGLVGDSIVDGRISATGDANGETGFAAVALNSHFGYVRISQHSEGVQNFLGASQRRHRWAAIAGCTHAICNYGVNDLRGGRTAAQVEADLLQLWKQLSTRGIKTWQTTITPTGTTSTDAWATTANQTIQSAANETQRVAVNAWIRDGAPILNGAVAATGSSAGGTLRAGQSGHPLSGYFEAADKVESARDSGIFIGGYTADGVHPGGAGTPSAGVAAMATAIDTTRFAL